MERRVPGLDSRSSEYDRLLRLGAVMNSRTLRTRRPAVAGLRAATATLPSQLLRWASAWRR
eukprot:14318589-Alexandrium_andersonii.AAC.1